MPETEQNDRPDSGVLLEAENGPAIEYDETGLILHLADKVVADLAQRLGISGIPIAQEAAAQPQASMHRPDPAILGDIDAWELHQEGDWYRFVARLPGAEGSRHYLRPTSGGGIIAETGSAVLGIFGLGGGRQNTTWSETPRFRHHIVTAKCPSEGEPDRLVENLRETSGESALGDALLARRHEAFRALPLIVTGQELLPPGPATDIIPTLDALSDRVTRWRGLAGELGKKARLLALRVSPGHDLTAESAEQFHKAALAQLDAIAARLPENEFGQIKFLTIADCGAWWQADAEANRAALDGQHQLILRPGGHHLIVTAPSYMFAQDNLGQPTYQAALARAEMEAYALETDLARESWTCPLLCLAEREGDVIRATFKHEGGLVIDAGDPFAAGPVAGFALAGTDAEITSVKIAPDDPGAVLIRVAGDLAPKPGATTLRLDYAIGGAERQRAEQNYAAACGALRDHWQAPAPDGSRLHRWALPGSLELH